MNELPITFKLMPAAILMGVILILLSLPMLKNKIGPNWFYGFRTRKTFSSTEVWYKANRYAAKEIIATSMVTIILAIISMAMFLRFTMFTTIQATGLFWVIITVPLVIAIVRSLLYLKKL